MTSKSKDTEAFVWIWLPDETRPIVAGKMVSDGKDIEFNYGKSYLERRHDNRAAISIYEPELPSSQNLPECRSFFLTGGKQSSGHF